MREKGHLEGASREHFGAREAEAFKDRLALLRRVSPAERLATLAALLDGSSEAERPALVVELIELAAPFGSEGGPCVASSVMRRFGERRRKTSDSALALLARRWEEIPDELKGAARSVGAGRWGGLAAQLASDTESGVRRSLAKLCSDCADADLAGTVVGLLADPDPGTGAAAEQALLALAFSLSGIDARTGERRGDEPVHQRRDPLIEEAIGRAVMSVSEHRRRGPFVAAMALLAPWRLRRKYDDSGERLASWFRDPPAESRGALRAAIRLSSHPLARGRALEWLAIATLSDACAERLARARTPDEHEAVLQRSHLLANPVRARAMKGIDIKAVRSKTVAASAGRREAALPDAVMLASLSVTARRGLARYVGSLDTSVENRRAALEPLLSDPDALARLASLGHSTGAGVLDLCFDADARVARSALMSWSLIGERGAGAGFEARLNLSSEPARRRTLSRLARSSHGAVRRMAVQESKFIECLDPASPASRVCARWLMLRDPGLLENRVREAMGSPDQARRVRAVQLVRYLGWCARFEPELLAIVESTPEEGRAAATAVAALGELQTPSSIAVVQSRLADADLRVRANAVEALARQSRGHGDLASDCPSAYGMLIELKDDADHRVRANALRALLGRPSVAIEGKPGLRAQRLYEPAAVESLAEMLVDPRASHRLAAAWLAGRVLPLEGRARLGKRFAELATRVGEAAAGDEDTDVRRRARQCVETLRSELRTAWAGRARKREKPVSGAAA